MPHQAFGKSSACSMFLACVCTITSSCSRDQDVENRQDSELTSVDRVLDTDSRLGGIRNQFCENHPIADAVRSYVHDMNQIRFDGCPPKFTSAFRNHIKAWEDSIPFFERFPEMRGEMHNLFEKIRSLDKESKSQLEKIEKKIWGTWDLIEVESKKVAVE